MGCRCATSFGDIDLPSDLALVTLSLKILRGLYLSNGMVFCFTMGGGGGGGG